MSINTACSSGLVAIHMSSSTLRAAECDRGLSCAVKAMLLPNSIPESLVAPDGRSKSFDARGDGYGRSEMFGGFALSSGEGATSALSGSAVRSGGRGASLTAPSGSGLSKTIGQAFAAASLTANEVACLQPQGLGSALADPIEVNASLVAFHPGREPRGSQLVIGCHKANMGHSEAPSGLVGCLVAIQVVNMTHKTAGNAHLRVLNPLIGQSSARAVLPLAFPTSEILAPVARSCGVTAFGVSGIIAHAVVISGGGTQR
eukprot:2644821-Prymnesium_polylepis.1